MMLSFRPESILVKSHVIFFKLLHNFKFIFSFIQPMKLTKEISPQEGNNKRQPWEFISIYSSSSPRCTSRALSHSEVIAGPAPSLGAHRSPSLALAERARVIRSYFSEQDPFILLLSRMRFSKKEQFNWSLVQCWSREQPEDILCLQGQ